MIEYETDIVGCARCGGIHPDIKFYPFTWPPSTTATHFAICPETHEPILAYSVNTRWQKLRAILRGDLLIRSVKK